MTQEMIVFPESFFGSLYMVEPLDHSYEPNWRDESQLKKVRHKNPQNHYDEKENNEWYGTD